LNLRIFDKCKVAVLPVLKMSNVNGCLVVLLLQKIALYVYAIVLLFDQPLVFYRYTNEIYKVDYTSVSILRLVLLFQVLKTYCSKNETLMKVDPMHLLCTIHSWFDAISHRSAVGHGTDANYSLYNVTHFLGLSQHSVLSPSLLQFGTCMLHRYSVSPLT